MCGFTPPVTREDGLTTVEREELIISRLRRENRQLKLEGEILSYQKPRPFVSENRPFTPLLSCAASWMSPPSGYYAWAKRPPSRLWAFAPGVEGISRRDWIGSRRRSHGTQSNEHDAKNVSSHGSDPYCKVCGSTPN